MATGMDIDDTTAAAGAVDPPAPAADAFAIDLRKHERILRQVFVTVSPDIFEPGFFDSATDMHGLVDMLCVCQFSVFTDEVYPKLGGDVSLFAYCVDSYHRARACSRLVAKAAERKTLLATLESFMVKYALVAIQQPGLFEVMNRNSSTLIMEQVVKVGDHLGFGDNFLNELILQLSQSDPGDLERTFAPVLVELQSHAAAEMSKGTSGAMRYIVAIGELVRHKPLRLVAVSLPNWKPMCTSGADVQMLTWLGPLMSASVCPGRVSDPETGPFKDVEKPQVTPDIQSTFNQIRGQTEAHNRTMHSIVLTLLSSKESKPRVLMWIEAAIRLNGDRQKMQNQMQDELDDKTADDGFMLNLCSVMLGLCEKYASPTDKAKWPPNFDKIDPQYLKSPSSRIDISKDTPLGEAKAPAHHLIDSLPPSYGDTRGSATPRAGGAAAAAVMSPGLASPGTPGSPNFVTESFFLTLRTLHVGLMPTIGRYKMAFLQERSEFHQLNRRAAQLEKELQQKGSLSAQDQFMLERCTNRIAVLTRKFFSLMAHLGDENYLSKVLSFYAFVCAWLLSLVDPEERGLPLCPDVPFTFAQLPEHIVDDIADFMSFAAHVCPSAVEGLLPTRLSTIARFFTTFIGDQTYIRNPYVLSKFVGVMAEFTPETRAKRRERGESDHSYFFQVALSEPTSVQHLAPALMRFFVNMEETDVYERGNKRRQVATIMQTLWKSDAHRMALVKDSSGPEFTRFIMLLINDTVDLFDSGREYLGTHLDALKETQHPDFASRPQAEQDDVSQRLQQNESTSKYFFEFGMEMMNIFTYLTTEIVQPVLEPELVQRLGYLLNFNLVDMVLKAKAPERYHEYIKVGMEPADLILKLVTVYVQVAGVYGQPVSAELHTPFLEAVARDGRSFRPDVFRDAIVVVKSKYPAKQDAIDMMDAFMGLVDRFEAVADADDALDADLGDIPDEFADPIMATLMLDPVKLPTSGQVMDRSHIRAHLLSNPRDPFNRNPLRIEDLVPDDELRKRIEAWVAERRAAAAAGLPPTDMEE